MHLRTIRLRSFCCFLLLLAACTPNRVPSAEVKLAEVTRIPTQGAEGFTFADGARQLRFPADFGAHPDFQTEWWYYTGNLKTQEDRRFGFELTIFRVGLLPPKVELPADSKWSGRDVYLAHFAISDIADNKFHAFERYSRPGPGLAGAQADPYRVWLEDWSISETDTDHYQLQAAQGEVAIQLSLTDEMGVVLHGVDGYSRKGKNIHNASYYYSQPRLQAEGFIQLNDVAYPVSGLVWKDHEFSTSVLEEDQIGWDWFSLQFGDGRALMLFQLRERDGKTSEASSGTFINADGTSQTLHSSDFRIVVADEWRSPHTAAVYPSAWQIQLAEQDCTVDIQPWMADQEINFSAVTYWEGAVHLEGTCGGQPVQGNGYVELTGYAGSLPLP